MYKIVSPVIVFRECIYQISLVLSVKQYLVIDTFLVLFNIFRTIKIIRTVLCNAEVFDICDFLSLADYEIRSIWFVRVQNLVLIERLIFVVDLVKIQKVCDVYLFLRPENLIVQRLYLLGLVVDYLLNVFLNITFNSGKLSPGNELKIFCQIFSFVWSSKI